MYTIKHVYILSTSKMHGASEI